MTDDRVEQVLEAARRLVAAFARNDAEAYFAAFSEDASFIFHNWPQPLRSRAAYRKLLGALATRGRLRSAGVRIQQYLRQPARRPGDLQPRCRHPGCASRGTESLNRERETILFRLEQQEGRWLACHEHLSAMPEYLPSTS
ncbi:ketosteroid isomerase [Pseudomonas aeruginosa]|nr:ketosteroid isomerase [Pseudomonas aeruginosa]